MCKNKSAFTLIELLVVVLIIGILSAIALPQYQKAVMKTRYATMKHMTHALNQAQQLYYLANGTYSSKMADLGICTPEESHEDQCNYSWGVCKIYASNPRVQCHYPDIDLSYQIDVDTAERLCLARNWDLNSLQNKVCKAETGAASGWKSTDENNQYYAWTYAD